MDDGEMLTVSQFARLHDVNARTLHYYDDIGLFQPKRRGENGYRYYDASQSLEFEYIRMLRDLGLGIEEIKDYVSHPGEARFVSILGRLQVEVRARKARLERLKEDLNRKATYLADCASISEDRIEVVRRPETRLLIMDSGCAGDGDGTVGFIQGVRRQWGIDRLRSGIGSFIAVDKARSGEFGRYDGFFVSDDGVEDGADDGVESRCVRPDGCAAITLPAGKYLCGYHRGAWSGLPALYRKMLEHADACGLKLGDYAYERGLNEFAIASPEDYVTRILIPIRD